MKYGVIALSLITLMSAASAVHFHRTAAAERDRAVQLEARLAALEPDAVAAAPRSREPDIDAPPASVETRAFGVAANSSAPVAEKKGRPMPLEQSREDMQRMRKRHQEVMARPEYREAMRNQQRRFLPHSYPGLQQALELSREEYNAFLDFLADQQLRQREVFENFDPAQAEQMHQRHMQAQQRMEQELQSHLGSKYAAWQEYQRTLPARHQVSQVEASLAAAGMPLGADQSRQLVEAYTREHEQVAQGLNASPAGTVRGFIAPVGSFNADGVAQLSDHFEQQIQSIEQRNRRLLDMTAGILSTEQHDIYRQQLEDELTMERAHMEVAKQNAVSGGSWQPFPGATTVTFSAAGSFQSVAPAEEQPD